MKRKPIILKQLAAECDITQGALAEGTGVKRVTVNLVLNHYPYSPIDNPEFKHLVEEKIRKNAAAIRWMAERRIKLDRIWMPLSKDCGRTMPVGAHARTGATRKIRPMQPGDPLTLTPALSPEWRGRNGEKINAYEVTMINEPTKRHFKLFRSPFVNDVLDDKDVFMSEDHRYIEAAMLDAAKHQGFLAVIGEVQSGKSVIRRKVALALQREGKIRIIYPQIFDKNRVTASSLCVAIIHDISGEKPLMNLEGKSRQVHRLLLSRHKQGLRHVMMIEEAHDLTFQVIKLLKRFYELEDGYTKLLGIILIGQGELKEKLDDEAYPHMREAVRRIQIAEIKGLNGNIESYLTFKFKRTGADITNVFTHDAIVMLGKRLSDKDGRTGDPISLATPGQVNNYAARAMNLACEMGEACVTEEVVRAL
jgi:type II secretory pathway predicted ATPase ExeA